MLDGGEVDPDRRRRGRSRASAALLDGGEVDPGHDHGCAQLDDT
jgi:hypothetical protein